MDKISVIIPTYNRFKFLLNSIKSIKEQKYSNIEIIVINDNSNEKEYYTYDFKDIIIIHLDINNCSRKIHNYPCVGYVRNIGIDKATGKYIAFCDDDDIWLPNKLEKQIKILNENKEYKMCCSDGLIGSGIYNSKFNYKKYNAEHYYNNLKSKYTTTTYFDNGFPLIFTLDFLKIHNCIITSSVIVERSILNKVNNMPFNRRGQDYQCWLKILEHTNCIYLKNDVLFYYDCNHGEGSNH